MRPTFVSSTGRPAHRQGLLGQFDDLTRLTRVVEFNDVEGLRRELAHGDVACFITEPVLTNSSMVLPEPGYLEAVRQLTREAGTLLLIDETHTISTGPGGYTRAHGLDPDLFVLGKPIAGGIPASVWGMTDAVAQRLDAVRARMPPGHSGMGTTLSANALALAAMRATLEHVMTIDAYRSMEQLAGVLVDGLRDAITAPACRGTRCGSGHASSSSAHRVRCSTARRPRRPMRRSSSGRFTCPAQSWLPDRAVPQHDAGLSGHDRRTDVRHCTSRSPQRSDTLVA